MARIPGAGVSAVAVEGMYKRPFISTPPDPMKRTFTTRTFPPSVWVYQAIRLPTATRTKATINKIVDFFFIFLVSECECLDQDEH
jgi:hypothetical protein